MGGSFLAECRDYMIAKRTSSLESSAADCDHIATLGLLFVRRHNSVSRILEILRHYLDGVT